MRLSLVKTAVDESGDRQIAREARWLRELESVAELEGQVPRVVEEGTAADGHRFLVIALPAGAGERRGGETRAFTREHAKFLATLGKARFHVSDFELSGCGQRLQHALGRVQHIASAKDFATLQGAFRDCETALLYWTGPYVLAQGEFAPWNIRKHGSGLFVSEWGHARSDASPLDDVLHYLMIQRALNQRPVTARFLQGSMQRAGEYARQAYPEWTWRAPVIGALTLAYLLGATLHRSLQRQRVDRRDAVVGPYWRLLERRAAWMPE